MSLNPSDCNINVRVAFSYGSLFNFLRSKSFQALILIDISDPERLHQIFSPPFKSAHTLKTTTAINGLQGNFQWDLLPSCVSFFLEKFCQILSLQFQLTSTLKLMHSLNNNVHNNQAKYMRSKKKENSFKFNQFQCQAIFTAQSYIWWGLLGGVNI